MSHDENYIGYDEKDFTLMKDLDGVLFCRRCGSFVGNPQIHNKWHGDKK